MIREGLVFCLMFLLFFIITMISPASLKHSSEPTNNVSSVAKRECVTVPGRCFAGGCEGGTCSPCPFDPLLCCPLILGNCTSAGGVHYGLCNIVCEW